MCRSEVELRRSEEQCHGRRMSDEHRCRRNNVGGIRARATVSASPGRGSGLGRMERGMQPGCIVREKGTRLEWFGSKSLSNQIGAALAGKGCRTTAALEWSEEQRHGRR